MPQRPPFRTSFCSLIIISLLLSACGVSVPSQSQSSSIQTEQLTQTSETTKKLVIPSETAAPTTNPDSPHSVFKEVSKDRYFRTSVRYPYLYQEEHQNRDKCYDRIYSKEPTLQVMKEDDGSSSTISFETLLLPNDIFPYTSLVLTADEEHLLVKNHTNSEDQNYTLSLWNTKTETKQILTSVKLGRSIQDVLVSEKYFYWVETSDKLGSSTTQWKIMKMDRNTQEISEILTYEESQSDLVPRILNYKDSLLFISRDSAKDTFTIIRMNVETGEQQMLFSLNSLLNPYSCLKNYNDCLYIQDFETTCKILKYDLTSNLLYEFYPPTEYRTEYIEFIAPSNDCIVYTNEFGLSYLYDYKTEKAKLFCASLFSSVFVDDTLIFSGNTNLYSLKKGSDSYQKLIKSDSDTEQIHYFGYFKPMANDVTIFGSSYTPGEDSIVIRMKQNPG